VVRVRVLSRRLVIQRLALWPLLCSGATDGFHNDLRPFRRK